jgi:nucleoside-diphosphate-sugar epimerase
VAGGADVLVSFPPDGETDAIVAPACAAAHRVIYISSTGVYGKKTGRIDDTTAADPSDERMRPRLEAESIWKEHGAIVLRAPGIYGPKSGLHLRLAEGSYKMPAGGANLISRIHVNDLASIVLAIFERSKLSDTTYLVGDENPCTLAEVVEWLCKRMELPMPESVPPEDAHATMRGNRAVDASRITKELGLTLKYPSFREGYAQCLEQ